MKREEETGEEITFLFEEKKGSGWESRLKRTAAAAPVKDQQFAGHEIYKGRTLGLRGSCKLKGSQSRQCAWGCCFYVCFWVSLMESIFKMYEKCTELSGSTVWQPLAREVSRPFVARSLCGGRSGEVASSKGFSRCDALRVNQMCSLFYKMR